MAFFRFAILSILVVVVCCSKSEEEPQQSKPATAELLVQPAVRSIRANSSLPPRIKTVSREMNYNFRKTRTGQTPTHNITFDVCNVGGGVGYYMVEFDGDSSWLDLKGATEHEEVGGYVAGHVNSGMCDRITATIDATGKEPGEYREQVKVRQVVPPCTSDADCDDGIDCTIDDCLEGGVPHDWCRHVLDHSRCQDDGQFCNGAERCDPGAGCVHSGSPCGEGETCDESTDVCRSADGTPVGTPASPMPTG